MAAGGHGEPGVGDLSTPWSLASVVIFSVAAEFSSGIAAAGALLASGALTVRRTVAALILGSIVATPIRACGTNFPRTPAFSRPNWGPNYFLTSQGLRIISLILVPCPTYGWVKGMSRPRSPPEPVDGFSTGTAAAWGGDGSTFGPGGTVRACRPRSAPAGRRFSHGPGAPAIAVGCLGRAW